MRKNEYICLNMLDVSASIEDLNLSELPDPRPWNLVTKKEKKNQKQTSI